MTYLVFALIVAAAVAYLYFSDARTQVQAAATNPELTQLNERLQVLRNALKDIEYEKAVGKMDAENFSRLQNEFLVEWEQIGEKIAALPKVAEESVPAAAACPQCGATILTAAAKFCHACGARVAQILIALLLIFYCAQSTPLAAFDINVTLKNGTTGQAVNAPLNVQLLKLEQGMQPVTAKPATAGKVSFLNLPEMTSGPYMVQALYDGVTYSRVIPPNAQSGGEVVIEIFESTVSAEKLRVRTLIELRRTDKTSLAGLVIFFFVNNGKKTFTGGKNGLEFSLPPGAEPEQASISVGSGSSNIQWLKLNAQKTDRANVFSVGQNVKPGERILQVMFRMPYDEKGTGVVFRSLYPQDTGMQLIAEPEDLQVKSGEKILTRTVDENLGRGLMGFTAGETDLKLMLSGGGIAQSRKSEEAEIEIHSPLALWQKLTFPLIAIGIFVLVALRRSR